MGMTKSEMGPSDAHGTEIGNCHDQMNCSGGGKHAYPPTQSPVAMLRLSSVNADDSERATKDSNKPEVQSEQMTLHGHPVTISRCKFQAHMARAYTIADAEAVGKAVSALTEREADFSNFVFPFAYRFKCTGNQEPSTSHVRTSRAAAATQMKRGAFVCDSGAAKGTRIFEGFCDNGDVGSGEKLLYLLQKLDIRNRVLVVTRIDQGFVAAELLGIRRYKFVLDRAKRLLEGSDLVSLRRAVDTDLSPSSCVTDLFHGHGLAPSRGTVRIQTCVSPGASNTDSIAAVQDAWDTFVLPRSAQRRNPEHTKNVRPPGRLDARDNGNGQRNRDGKGPVRVAPSTERRAMSVAQLSISSATVTFPPGHVPCCMGTKGHGTKRGRVNHFAVRTPPSTAGYEQDVDCNMNPKGWQNGDGATSDTGPHMATMSEWSLPCNLGPASRSATLGREDACGSITATANRGVEGEFQTGRGGDNRSGDSKGRRTSHSTLEAGNRSFMSDAIASRASSCATINSPTRIAAIMRGMYTEMSNEHHLHPPPIGRHVQHAGSSEVPPAVVSNTAGCFRSPVSAGLSSGFTRDPGDGMCGRHIDDCNSNSDINVNINVGIDSAVNIGSALPLPLLRGTPGTGVMGDVPPSAVNGDAHSLVGSSSSVGGWKEDDYSGTIFSNPRGADDFCEQARAHCSSVPLVDPGIDGVPSALQGGGQQRTQHGMEQEEMKQCGSPGLWSMGFPTPRRDSIAGDGGDVTPRYRNRSALRGWTVGRAAPPLSNK